MNSPYRRIPPYHSQLYMVQQKSIGAGFLFATTMAPIDDNFLVRVQRFRFIAISRNDPPSDTNTVVDGSGVDETLVSVQTPGS